MGKDSALNGVPRWGAFVLPKRPKSGFRGLGMMNPFSWINASQANVVMPQRKIRNPEALETMFYYGKNQDKDAIVIDKSWFDFDGRIVEITAEELEEDRKENPAEIWGDFILGENDAQYHMTEPALEEADATIPPIRIYSKNMNVDCTGMNCPYPVLMAKNALKEMQPGETLTLTATDWEAEYDVPLLAERYGHELESVEKNRATGEIIFTIKKGGSRSYNQEKGDVPFRKSLEKSGNYIQCAGCGSKTKSRCRCEGGKTMSPMVDYSEEERLKGKRKFNKRRFNKRTLSLTERRKEKLRLNPELLQDEINKAQQRLEVEREAYLSWITIAMDGGKLANKGRIKEPEGAIRVAMVREQRDRRLIELGVRFDKRGRVTKATRARYEKVKDRVEAMPFDFMEVIINQRMELEAIEKRLMDLRAIRNQRNIQRARDRRYNSRYRDWNMKIDEAISKLELSGGRFSTISELQRMKDTIRSAEEMGIELDADQIDDVIIEGLSSEAKKAVDWRSMILGDDLDIETLFESPQRVDATDFTAMPPFTTDEMPSDFMSLPIDLQQEVNRIEDSLMVQDTLDSFTELDTADKFDFESEFDKILEGL